MNKIQLLFLPGLVCDQRLWQAQADGLADIAHSKVADLSAAESISLLATSALAQAPAGQFALAGLSMGGYIALEIMRQAPERVLALALLDTSARPDTEEASANRRTAIEQAKTDYKTVIEKLTAKLIHPDHLQNTALTDVIAAMAHSLGKDVFIQQQNAIIGRKDSRESLNNIQCPTLILCGRDDGVTPLEVHEEMHRKIRNSQLRVIETCGHLSTLEQPGQVTAALRTWLSAISK